jgi:hypothetical protein
MTIEFQSQLKFWLPYWMSSFFSLWEGGGTKGFFTLRNFVVERMINKLQNKIEKTYLQREISTSQS